MSIERVFLIVLDSVGIGEMPDASLYNDEGSNTLKSCYTQKGFSVSNLKGLGLFNIDGIDYAEDTDNPKAAYGRCTEKSKGKDTTIGHWEIAGIISEKPLPTYPNGFPEEIIDKIKKKTGRGVLCNKPYSGTEVIKDYGEEHIRTGDLIIYTSADSVLQIAAHEDIIPIKNLYEICRITRDIMQGEHGVGRVIARPFSGLFPNFSRTSNRHDFSLVPHQKTFIEELKENGFDTISVGKINDIFAGKGFGRSCPTKSNADGMQTLSKIQKENFIGLCFANLVDFDMVYGHRNNVEGYANALMEFDKWLEKFKKNMNENDILIVTADHGCDPITLSTDHSREYTPLLIYGKKVKPVNLGTRQCFADIGKTIADMFKIDSKIAGESFKKEIMEEK